MLRLTSEDTEFALGPPAAEVGRATYWSAPGLYRGKQLTAYRGHLEVITRFASPSIRSSPTSVYDNYTLSRIWITEPDVVIEVGRFLLLIMLNQMFGSLSLLTKFK